jgi:hypothetical protein
MALSPPRVVPPLNACSDRVRLQGQVTGATVEIFASRTNIYDRVFQGTASAPDETFELTRLLDEGEQVFARQSLPGEISPITPRLEIVQPRPKPSEVGPLMAHTHLFRCGECLMLGNAYQGARVEVFSQTRGKLGEAIAADSRARVHLNQPLLLNEDITAVQTVCGIPSLPVALPSPDEPPSRDRILETPSLKTPIYACDGAVRVEGVADGARVSLYRDDENQPYATACFDLSGLWFRVSDPFKQGETVFVEQRMQNCEYASERAKAGVDRPQAVPVPSVVGPLCPGSFAVRVTGLRYGARVNIMQQGLEIGGGEAWDETCDFFIDPLDPKRGQDVSAQQALCERWSPLSDPVTIDRRPFDLEKPLVVEPLYDCGGMVRVTNIHPGAYVSVWNQNRLLAAGWVYQATQEFLV